MVEFRFFDIFYHPKPSKKIVLKAKYSSVASIIWTSHLNEWFAVQNLDRASRKPISKLFVRHSSDDKRRNERKVQLDCFQTLNEEMIGC